MINNAISQIKFHRKQKLLLFLQKTLVFRQVMTQEPKSYLDQLSPEMIADIGSIVESGLGPKAKAKNIRALLAVNVATKGIDGERLIAQLLQNND
mgnify:FL=1